MHQRNVLLLLKDEKSRGGGNFGRRGAVLGRFLGVPLDGAARLVRVVGSVALVMMDMP